MSDFRYSILRNKIFNSPCTMKMLEKILNLVTKDINSRRRMDSVNTIKDVILLLEKRDLINVNNLSYLNNIASLLRINDNEVNPGVTTAVRSQHIIPQATMCEEAGPFYNRRVLNLEATTSREQIYSLICEEIGAKWKDLARNLKINEGQIDDLEQRYPRTSDRVREILLYYEKTNCQENYYDLLESLTRSRRTDLSIKVQDILKNHTH